MDFLSLPDDIKNIIFSKLHWKTLDNVRLTCRGLYLFLYHNYRRIDKQGLSVMCVYCHKWKPNTEIIGIKFKPCVETTNNDSDADYLLRRPKRVHFTDLYMYRTFLQRFDLTNLIRLQFIINTKTDVVKLFNNYFNRESCLKEVVLEYTGIPDEESITNILELILKAKNTKTICLRFAVPKPNKNEELNCINLNGLEGTNNNNNTVELSSARVIGKLIYNSPSICRIEITTQIDNFYFNVIKSFFETEKSTEESLCKHTSEKTLYFEDCSMAQKDIIKDAFVKYNYETTSTWYGDGSKLYLTGLKNCPSCGAPVSLNVDI
uniref:F-box domain-containing protein n=1 Tax=Strongyloides venezuelensis TaxID=75913 RepID=A0A0K0FMX8_STRVS